ARPRARRILLQAGQRPDRLSGLAVAHAARAAAAGRQRSARTPATIYRGRARPLQPAPPWQDPGDRRARQGRVRRRGPRRARRAHIHADEEHRYLRRVPLHARQAGLRVRHSGHRFQGEDDVRHPPRPRWADVQVLTGWGAPKWPPKPPNARSAPGNPWRSSITRYPYWTLMISAMSA